MKYISIIEQASPKAIELFARAHNLEDKLKFYTHPQEDYLIAAPPRFVVADGVTLNLRKLAECNQDYPNPSPSGEVAEIFCKAVIKSRSKDTLGVFKEANAKVTEYNNRLGKNDLAGNPTGYYAATGAFVLVENGRVFWANICDSFVAHFSGEMGRKHQSDSSCRPYAVINGEARMSEHVEHSSWELASGDRLFLCTDGFAEYFNNDEFLGLFADWNDTLETRVREFSRRWAERDPERYGHERSLIAIEWR